MDTYQPNKHGKSKVSIRVLFSHEDYQELKRIATLERTDISTLVRRAVARSFFIPADSNTVNH